MTRVPGTGPGQGIADRPRSGAVLAGGTVAAFCATFLFRWLTVTFTNDHFVHLSRGRQILFGELPVRDFFDPGLPLHYLASTGALAVFGNNLVGEAILTVAFVALGAALTFYLSARASGSLIVAAAAALAAVAAFPRLYNYPKVFLYVLALFWAWRYAERRTTGSLIALSGVTAAAFLFRHDHGVYIGASSIALLVLAHWGSPGRTARAGARYALLTALFLLPYFAFLQQTVGIVGYVRSMPEVEPLVTPRLMRLPIAIDWSEPVVAIDPPSAGKVAVRWSAGLDAARRRELEARHGLALPVEQAGHVWRYELTDDDPDNVRRLLGEKAAADVSGIDRETLRPVVHHRWLRDVRNSIPLLRMRLGPGIFTEQNALAWLYYVTMILPVAGLGLVAAGWWRGTLTRAQVAAWGTTAVMCAVANQGLIRESPDSRLADVAAPAAVLGAVVTALFLHGRRRSVLARGVAGTIWAVTLWSAAAHGQAGERLATARLLAGPGAIRERLSDVNAWLSLRPIDGFAPPGSTGLRALTRYVFECTAPSDRVIVTWFAPEVFFYSERLFAGGQVYLDPGGWHASEADQQLTIRRLRHERVPVVLVSAEWEETVRKRFAPVFAHLELHYVTVARSAFGGDRDYVVLASRSLPPSGIYEPLKLPCYQ